MFNIRFHAGSRRERAPFVGGRLTVMNDTRPAISNATTALFPSDVNPVGNSATEYRTRKDSEDVRPATKLLRRVSPFGPLIISSWSPFALPQLRLPSRRNSPADDSQSVWRDCIRRNLYSYARYSRTTLAENPETSELRFLLERRLPPPLAKINMRMPRASRFS